MTGAVHTHDFQVRKNRIDIFGSKTGLSEIVGDGEMIVYISVGPGETHVSVLTDEAKRRAHWTAVFGWSSLCAMGVDHAGRNVPLEGPGQVDRALRGVLRLYGDPVDTGAFRDAARERLRGALGYILDQTIGDGSDYDRILLAGPDWLQDTLADCTDLRPHMSPEIQDL